MQAYPTETEEAASILFSKKDFYPICSSGKACSSGCTMSDLFPEDKKKISDLLRKVIFLTEDNDRAWKEVAAEQKARSELVIQNRELASELATLKSKLTHSLDLLRSYQVRARDMQHFLSQCSIPGHTLFDTANAASSMKRQTESEASSCNTLAASGQSLTATSTEFGFDAEGASIRSKPIIAISTQFPSPIRITPDTAQTVMVVDEDPLESHSKSPTPNYVDKHNSKSPLHVEAISSHSHNLSENSCCQDQAVQYSPRQIQDTHPFDQPVPTFLAAPRNNPISQKIKSCDHDKENESPICASKNSSVNTLSQVIPAQQIGSSIEDQGQSLPACHQHTATAVTCTPAAGRGVREKCGPGLSPRSAMCIAAAALRESTPAPKPPPPAPHVFLPRPPSNAPTPGAIAAGSTDRGAGNVRRSPPASNLTQPPLRRPCKTVAYT